MRGYAKSIIGRKLLCYFFRVVLILMVFWPVVYSEAQQAPKSGREQELAKLIQGAKAEGKLIWYSGLHPEESKPVIEGFQKKYPFIKIEHVRIHATESREQMLRELLAGVVKFDLFDIGGEQVPEFKKAGLLERYDWTKAFDVSPVQLDKDQMLLSVGASVKGIAYNTKLVNEKDLPKTWEDLLDPKWKGKFVLDTRPKTFLQLMPVWGEARVYEYLKKLVANKPIFRRGQAETVELLAAGDFPMIGGTYSHTILRTKKRGAPVEFLALDIVPVTLEDEAIVKGASHPNAAKLVLGWLANEGQKYFDEVTDRGIPLPGYDTGSARLVKGKKLSLFIGEWIDREAELQEKAIKAMGKE